MMFMVVSEVVLQTQQCGCLRRCARLGAPRGQLSGAPRSPPTEWAPPPALARGSGRSVFLFSLPDRGRGPLGGGTRAALDPSQAHRPWPPARPLEAGGPLTLSRPEPRVTTATIPQSPTRLSCAPGVRPRVPQAPVCLCSWEVGSAVWPAPCHACVCGGCRALPAGAAEAGVPMHPRAWTWAPTWGCRGPAVGLALAPRSWAMEGGRLRKGPGLNTWPRTSSGGGGGGGGTACRQRAAWDAEGTGSGPTRGQPGLRAQGLDASQGRAGRLHWTDALD